MRKFHIKVNLYVFYCRYDQIDPLKVIHKSKNLFNANSKLFLKYLIREFLFSIDRNIFLQM